MSKGSKRRPSVIHQSAFDMNWERTFGKKDTVEMYVHDNTVTCRLCGHRYHWDTWMCPQCGARPANPPCLNYREYGMVCLKGAEHGGSCGGHQAGCHCGFNCSCPGALQGDNQTLGTEVPE